MSRRRDDVLDALPAHVALLDRDGVILSTNAAWNNFGASNDYSGTGCGVGLNYIDICRQATGDCSEEALRVGDAITAVLGGTRKPISVDYTCHSPSERRWFRMTVAPAPIGADGGAVVMHVNITDMAALDEVMRQNERRFRALFQQHPQPMYITDLQSLMFLGVNDAATVQYGFSHEEFSRMSLDDIRPAHEVERLHAYLAKLGDNLQHAGLWYHHRRDGQPITVDIASHRMTFKGRAAMMTLAVDVTERLAADRALRESIAEHVCTLDALRLSEQRFRLVAEAAHVAIWDWDLQSNQVWWNEGFESVFGVRDSQRDAHHDWWMAGLHPDDRARVLLTLNESLRDGSIDWSCEYRFRRADDTYAGVRDHAHIVRNEAGTPLRMIGGTTDLTAQQSVETRLREQAALLDAAHDAILLKDMDDRIVYWNKGAERLLGWTAKEAIGRIATDLFGVNKPAYLAARTALLEHGQWEGELIKRTRDGRDLSVEVRWTIVWGDNGEPRAVLAITLDVTERKRLESQFLRAQRLESIGTLAGGIAHDLNNVLAPIMMSIDLLRNDQCDAETLETLATIEAAAQRGADMVKQVLTFARGAEGERHAIDPSLVVRDVAKIARETFPKDVSVRVRSAPDLWMVQADPTQLHQVMMNLAVNARDAMPTGGVLEMRLANTTLDETYAAMHPGTSPGPHVSITVVDTGTGIPRDVQDRLFEPFFTTKEQGKGTGLGLSTLHTIVRTHGGSVTVYSEPGRGATFVVLFPAVSGSSTTPDVKHSELALPRGDGQLILVVDDEASIRTIVERTLTRFGYEVLLASNGAEAVARYVEHRGRIAAVVTDVAMPVMDGPAMVVALHAIDPGARIIGSSGMLSNESHAQLVAAGVSHFVAKPYTAEALLTALAGVLAE